MNDFNSHLDFATGLDFSSILTNPILDVAARLWEEDRYTAFKTCYRSMRRIDDLVDHRRVDHRPLDSEEINRIESSITGWLQAVRQREPVDTFTRDFMITLDQFCIPFWPWERLGQAMVYDLHHNGFASFHVFLRYCEGAAIAPAAVFMHLSGVKRQGNDYLAPQYDIRKAARPLAIFSYLVHIMRDFEKDQREGLNYFADSFLSAHDLTSEELRQLALGRKSTPGLLSLMQTYLELASEYRLRARAQLEQTKPMLEPRYQVSLELIYALYNQIFEKIEAVGGDVISASGVPSPAEVEACIHKTINEFRSIV